MNARNLVCCGIFAALLGLAGAANCQAEDVVNEASYDIELKYCECRPEGWIWSEPFTIPAGYMVSLPNERQYDLVAVWRRAGTEGDGGWGFPTGLNPELTGYIGEFGSIEFRQ